MTMKRIKFVHVHALLPKVDDLFNLYPTGLVYDVTAANLVQNDTVTRTQKEITFECDEAHCS